MRNNIGIPTEYAGIRFRSRLEATWAVFFDLLNWPWEYEPFDLKGYIPDFVIPGIGFADEGDPISKDVVVDVKPIVNLADLAWRGHEIMGCGWQGVILCVGGRLVIDFNHILCIGHAVEWSNPKYASELGYRPGMDDNADIVRDRFGHLSVYEFQAHAYPIYFQKCSKCSRFRTNLTDLCPWCGSPEYGDFDLIRGGLENFAPIADEGLVKSMWATAKNRVQWKGEFGA